MKFRQATPSEVVSRGGGGALSGRKGTGLFWSKITREREVMGGGGGGECTRAFSQDPPQLNFLDVVF